MAEQYADSKVLEARAYGIINHLKVVAAEHKRTFSPTLQAVLVFSGPGTYYQPLKPEQEVWERWMDRDRIRAGVAVVREVTAARISELSSKTVKGAYVSKEDILNSGPFFVYNGTPEENEVFRRASNSKFCKLPLEKVLVIDEVRRKNAVQTIAHTAHQVESFYQELANPHSPLHGIENVALIAHIPDFIRIPFYTKKYNDEFVSQGGRNLNFWIYALKSRIGTEKEHIEWELPRLVRYASEGYLAIEPSNFSV